MNDFQVESDWKPGPLPPNTINYGGVVIKGMENTCGFWFADFCGDHVKINNPGTRGHDRRVEAADVLWYNNSLTMPPNCNFKSREGNSD